LDLWATDVTDAGLAHLKNLDRLEVLYLGCSRGRISDAGLAHLRGCVKLTSLNLHNTSVGDEGLVHVKELKNLQTLILWGTRVTDTGIDHLIALKDLRELNLNDTPVTTVGLAKLRGALPQCDVQHVNAKAGIRAATQVPDSSPSLPMAPMTDSSARPTAPTLELPQTVVPVTQAAADIPAMVISDEVRSILAEYESDVDRFARDAQRKAEATKKSAVTAIVNARPETIEKLKETVPAKLAADLEKIRSDAAKKVEASRKQALSSLKALRTKHAQDNDAEAMAAIDVAEKQIAESNPLASLPENSEVMPQESP
jgi:hypothetical protein